MMVAYNFKSGFVEAIKAGTKCHTIRRVGKRQHAMSGDMLQLYCGMRTKRCYKIVDDLRCIDSFHIQLTIDRDQVDVDINGLKLPVSKMDQFAIEDGFSCLDAFVRFWNCFHDDAHFEGRLICWAPSLAMEFVKGAK